MSTRKLYIWHEQGRNPEAEDGFGWLVGETPPTEMAYTFDCLEVDINPADLDRHANAQKGQDIYDYLIEHGINHKNMDDYSKIYTGTVVYDLENQEWGLLEDMEITPIVTHWDGNNMQYYALHEDRWQEEVIEVEEQATCLDRWDGNNMSTGGRFEHAHVYKSIDDRYVLVLSSQWEGSRDRAAALGQEEFLSYMENINRAEEANEIVERFSGDSGEPSLKKDVETLSDFSKMTSQEIWEGFVGSQSVNGFVQISREKGISDYKDMAKQYSNDIPNIFGESYTQEEINDIANKLEQHIIKNVPPFYKVWDVIGYQGSPGRAESRTLRAALRRAYGADKVERIVITGAAPQLGDCVITGRADFDGGTSPFVAKLPPVEYDKYNVPTVGGEYYSPPAGPDKSLSDRITDAQRRVDEGKRKKCPEVER